MTIPLSIIGIDLGKNWFHVVGLDAKGTVLLRKKLNRHQLSEFAATTPRCVVAMESCAGSQHWGRVFAAAGHEVRLLPGQFVKPYVQGNKNDFHDATAIAEAGQRARMRCVPLKTTEQIELQALHRVRQGIVRERTAVVNQMRGLLLNTGSSRRSGARASAGACPPRYSRPSVASRHVSLRSCIASDDGGSRSTRRLTTRHGN